MYPYMYMIAWRAVFSLARIGASLVSLSLYIYVSLPTYI